MSEEMELKTELLLNSLQKELKLMNEVRSFATKTGSALISGCNPRDYDYFALRNPEHIQKLRALGAADKGAGGPSLSHHDWGEQTVLIFHTGQGVNRKRVEVFFVEQRYYRVLQIYTHLLKCMSTHSRAAFYVLQIKEVRVALAEAIRDAVLTLGLFKTSPVDTLGGENNGS